MKMPTSALCIHYTTFFAVCLYTVMLKIFVFLTFLLLFRVNVLTKPVNGIILNVQTP